MRVNFAWNANTEQDIAGYKIYAGTATGTYDMTGSPRDVGNVTSGYFVVKTYGQPLYFALTAYNTSQQESGFSAEIVQTFTTPVMLRIR